MSDLEKRINKIFTPDNLKALDAAPDDQGPAADDQPEIIPAKKKIETRGRKNRGLTKKHYEEFKNDRKAFRKIKHADNFSQDIIERVAGDVVNDQDLNQFKELYTLTCDSILDDFRQNNPELIKKHPYNYYKKILAALKEATPRVGPDEIDKLIIIWDCLTLLLDDIGLYITYESFEKVTGVYKDQLKSRCGLSPKYADFCKKINKDVDGALINELQYNPYNQTNKMFIAKVHGIIEKTEPKQIEVTHNIQSFSNIAQYRLDDQGEN